MGWGVHDYPEPDLKWVQDHYIDDDEPYTDEWEEFNCDDIDIDEIYEADEDDLL